MHATLHNSHEDFLSSIHAIGPDRDQANAAVEEFLDEHSWHVEPGPADHPA
ncbi:hypothetical protein [Streptomyces sp. NPDC055189]